MEEKTQLFERLMLNHLSDNITDNDEQVLLEILNSDPKYNLLYSEMAKTRAISYFNVIEGDKRSNYKRLQKLVESRYLLNKQHNYIQYLFKIAAVIIIVISTSILTYYLSTENKSLTDTLANCETTVPLGSQAKTTLPDGTIAWLNSGSTLIYNKFFGKINREVTLTGEGYFRVTKDKSKPFFVHTNNIEIKVLGTVFNVRSYSNDPTVEVNLLEGKVDITSTDSPQKQKITLIPNEKLVYNKINKTMTLGKAVASKSALWTTGKLFFENATFKEIARDLERKFNILIIINTPRINNESFSGSLDLNQPIEKVLESIDMDKKYSKTYKDNTIIISNN